MTNRSRIYRALREAGPEGLTRTQLWEVVRAPCAAHIESLRLEGFEIEDVSFRNQRGVGVDWGWALVSDERRVAA